MLTATLTLTRTLDDGALAYRKYFLVADFGTHRGEGKASIIALSGAAPMPQVDQITVRGNENDALMAAADLVRQLDGNAGFAAEVNLEPSQ